MLKETEAEWFGFGILTEDSEPEEIERVFIGNVRYAEYACRERGLEKNHPTLALRLSALFDALPPECQRAITDDRDAPIRDIVRARNMFAHDMYESPRSTNERLLILSIKVAALLRFSEALRHDGAPTAIKLSQQSSLYKRKMLARTDKF
jgi:hypothetical protein